MTQETAEVPITTSPWGPVRFFMGIGSGLQAVAGWFYSNREEYPPDEAGELMRRYMANKSWFDHISCWWNGRSFMLKTAYISLITLGFGLAGLLAGASIIMALSAFILSIITHKLLISHETNRWRRARFIVAAESIELNEDLSASKNYLDEAVNILQLDHEALAVEIGSMQEQTVISNKASQLLQERIEIFVPLAESVEQETIIMSGLQTDVIREFEAISADLQACQEATKSSQVNVEAVGNAAARFLDSVSSMEKTQIKLGGAVDNICFFPREPKRAPVQVPVSEESATNARIAKFEQAADDYDMFIAELMAMVH